MLTDYAGREPQSPPDIDQVELVLFGPGYGESVLVHLGSNEWIIVDSCMASGSSVPAPIWYLQNIGVDPASAVKLIVATHWHDDHIKGMAQVVQACPSARFCTSPVLGDVEFLAMAIGYDERNMMKFRSGAEEILKVIKVQTAPIKDAGDGKLLYRLPKSRTGYNGDCEVYSLSPSDGDMADVNAGVKTHHWPE